MKVLQLSFLPVSDEEAARNQAKRSATKPLAYKLLRADDHPNLAVARFSVRSVGAELLAKRGKTWNRNRFHAGRCQRKRDSICRFADARHFRVEFNRHPFGAAAHRIGTMDFPTHLLTRPSDLALKILGLRVSGENHKINVLFSQRTQLPDKPLLRLRSHAAGSKLLLNLFASSLFLCNLLLKNKVIVEDFGLVEYCLLRSDICLGGFLICIRCLLIRGGQMFVCFRGILVGLPGCHVSVCRLLIGLSDLNPGGDLISSKVGIFNLANPTAEVNGSARTSEANERRSYKEDFIANAMLDLDSLSYLTLFEENQCRCP
jgi:hypothetical protein